MSNVIVKGTKWIKGLALLGLMVAMVGVFASAPAASASDSIVCPTAALGKINVVAVDSIKGDRVGGATVVVYNQSGEAVIKGTTDANGSFFTYSCTGTFKVKVFASGYKEYAEVVTISDNQTSSVKAALQPASRITAR